MVTLKSTVGGSDPHPPAEGLAYEMAPERLSTTA